MSLKAVALSLLILTNTVYGHGDGHEPAKGETVQQYAQRHMASEHHIDSFDLKSFFQLHDLNRDGIWDREEIEAIYGVHHVYSQKKSKDDVEHQKKADTISKAVFALLDKNKDGKVTAEEFELVGLKGLPNFDDLGAEGHHYDVESEFFLHHEEQFHSTPETQTDEAYNHPEDLEHFAQHESIERKESEKEAKFQGISVEEALKAHERVDAPVATPQAGPGHHSFDEAAEPQDSIQHPIAAAHPHAEQLVADPPIQAPPTDAGKPKINRVIPPEKQDPNVKFQGASQEGSKLPEWGTGDKGYQTPKNPSDKMRKNLPYKYKFRRNWGDF